MDRSLKLWKRLKKLLALVVISVGKKQRFSWLYVCVFICVCFHGCMCVFSPGGTRGECDSSIFYRRTEVMLFIFLFNTNKHTRTCAHKHLTHKVSMGHLTPVFFCVSEDYISTVKHTHTFRMINLWACKHTCVLQMLYMRKVLLFLSAELTVHDILFINILLSLWKCVCVSIFPANHRVCFLHVSKAQRTLKNQDDV